MPTSHLTAGTFLVCVLKPDNLTLIDFLTAITFANDPIHACRRVKKLYKDIRDSNDKLYALPLESKHAKELIQREGFSSIGQAIAFFADFETRAIVSIAKKRLRKSRKPAAARASRVPSDVAPAQAEVAAPIQMASKEISTAEFVADSLPHAEVAEIQAPVVAATIAEKMSAAISTVFDPFTVQVQTAAQKQAGEAKRRVSPRAAKRAANG